MDYFDNVGFDFSNDLWVYTAYSKAYSAAVKKDTINLVSFYEKKQEVDIPLYMLQGSLPEAQNIWSATVSTSTSWQQMFMMSANMLKFIEMMKS